MKNKIILTLICLFANLFLTFSQLPYYKWTKTLKSTTYSTFPDIQNNKVAKDFNGNIYTIGIFKGNVDFDPGETTFFLASNNSNLFIQKLNSNGEFVWAYKLNGADLNTAGGWGYDIKIDNDLNVIVTGGFGGQNVDFDPGPNNYFLSTTGLSEQDIFVLKLSNEGNFLWAKKIGGNTMTADYGKSMVLDNSGNIYITGRFAGSNVDFDPNVGVNLVSAIGFVDAYILKLSNNGELIWIKNIGSNSNQYTSVEGSGIEIDVNGNLYITGYLNGSNVDFDPGVGIHILNYNYGNFTLKLNNLGEFIWAKNVGGDCIALDKNGNAYVAGSFYGPNYPTTFDRNINIIKLDLNGNLIWAKQIGGNERDEAYGISIDNLNNIYICGSFMGSNIDFDTSSNNNLLTSNGASDSFVLKLNDNGDFKYAFNFGGVGYDGSSDIVVDLLGNILLTGGLYGSNVDLDFTQNVDLKSGNEYGGFTQKLTKCEIEGNVNYTLNSGNWDEPQNWSTNLIPNSCDYIFIKNNHIITMPDNFTGQANNLENNGNLIFGQNASLSLNRQ